MCCIKLSGTGRAFRALPEHARQARKIGADGTENRLQHRSGEDSAQRIQSAHDDGSFDRFNRRRPPGKVFWINAVDLQYGADELAHANVCAHHRLRLERRAECKAPQPLRCEVTRHSQTRHVNRRISRRARRRGGHCRRRRMESTAALEGNPGEQCQNAHYKNPKGHCGAPPFAAYSET